MAKGRKRGAIAAFICSIVPIGPAYLLVYLCRNLSSSGGHCQEGIADVILIFFVGLITAVVMMIMGIISVVFGTLAIRKPEPRCKTLAIVAIVLGILEIVAVVGFFIFVPSFYFNMA